MTEVGLPDSSEPEAADLQAEVRELADALRPHWPDLPSAVCGCSQSHLFGGEISVFHTSACLARDEQRRRIANRLRSQPWMNALAIADAIEKDEWDV